MSGDIDPKRQWAAITGQAPMPDRDPPELHAAVREAIARRTPDYHAAHPGAALAIECDVTLGYDAAFRSLGAPTPEAHAALRELVPAVINLLATCDDLDEQMGHKGIPMSGYYIDNRRLAAFRIFALLATPPEEGR